MSSSSSVSVTLDGAATPLPPEAAPETVTDLSGASTSLSFAVIVTVPVPVVAPAAMVNVFALDSMKSVPAVPAPGDADTVIVVAALDARFRVAVTVDTPPFSGINAGFSESVAFGAASSSVIVSVTSEGCTTPWELDAEPDTVTILSGESVVSLTAVTVTVPALVVAPAAIVSALFALSV